MVNPLPSPPNNNIQRFIVDGRVIICRPSDINQTITRLGIDGGSTARPRREGDNLALIAELIAPRIRMDNDNLEAENRVLRQDIRNLLRTSRDLANNNLNLQDTVRYLEGITERLIERVHRLEASILDCDDPVHDERRVRRRLVYDDEDIFETVDLTTDEVFSP